MVEFGTVLQDIRILENKVQIIKRLRQMRVDIMSSVGYYDNNVAYLTEKYDFKNIPLYVKELMLKSMEIEKNIGESIIPEFNNILDSYKSPIKKIVITDEQILRDSKRQMNNMIR